MKTKLNVLFVSPECVPFAKTGGLADVAGSLPKYLSKLGHDVRIVIPKYSFIDLKDYNVESLKDPMGVWMGTREEWCRVHFTEIEDNVKVYFIEFNLYFNREGLYHDNEFNDYTDNPKRFGFLSRAALQLCKNIKFKPDIVHANDWQTALTAAYLKIWDWNNKFLNKTASVLTIHNLAYQGIYPKTAYNYLGLREDNFTEEKFESYKKINFLKGGIYYADMVNTVSPTYREETKTVSGGFGLAPYLNNKKNNYIGILNGMDYSAWNPETDELIPKNYSIENMEGKKICKKVLQRRFLLKENENIAVIGVVSRLVSQKGLNYLAGVIEKIVNDMVVQFVILGSGDPDLHEFFYRIPAKYPGKIGSYLGYDNNLAHLIESGSDFFLMPSVYEPCGLNQMYSLKYGTVPIVRAVGGLNDTVEQYNELTGEGTGFKFDYINYDAIYYTVGWAISTYYDRKHHIQKLRENGMKQSFTWEKSAKEYEKLYDKAIKNKKKFDKNFLK